MAKAFTLFFVFFVFSVAACLDDSKPLDRGTDRARTPDSAVDLASDVRLTDLLAKDALRADLKIDAPRGDGAPKKDSATKDSGPSPDKKPAVDGAKPLLYGEVARTGQPLLDARGTVYVGLYMMGLPIPLASVQIPAADLSGPYASVKYEFWSAPAGTYSVFAFLDDNGSAGQPFIMADAGDLVMSAPINNVQIGAPQKLDLFLDKAENGFSAGGGGLKGRISATATPAATGDGKGPIYISLHSAVPPAGFVQLTQINSADLSASGKNELYYLATSTAGSFYLQVFLDDNANASIFALGPDTGDLISSQTVQVQINAGSVTSQDIVLDKLK